jgi:hypothetical protein
VNEEISLGLEAMLSAKKFPGCAWLTVSEVAAVLEIDKKHLRSLVREGLMGAIDISLRGDKSSRKYWRMPAPWYDAFIWHQANRSDSKLRDRF